MLKRTYQCAVDTVFSLEASFNDRTTGFETKRDLNQMSVQNNDIRNEVLADEKKVQK